MTGSVQTLPRPPLVKGLPVLHCLLPMISNPADFIRKQYERLGKAFRVKALNRELTVLAGIEANQYLGGDKRELFTSEISWRSFTEKAQCPHLLIGVDGECHAYQRKLLKPYFSKGALSDRVPMLHEIIERELDLLDGRAIHVNPFIKYLMSNQIGYVMQGVQASQEETDAFMLSQNTIVNVYMFKRWSKLALIDPRYLKARYISDRFRAKLKAFNQSVEKGDFQSYTDKVLEGRQAKPDWFTEGDVDAHIMLPYVGGVDTAGGTHSFILYELLNHPELLPRLRKEVDQAYANGIPDYRVYEQMDDLRGFIYECMRLHPTGFALNRNATDDFEFEGYRIRKGDELLVFTTATHRDERYFPEPDKFDIERYREPRNEHRQRYVFSPFGRGAHTCVAATLAEQQLMVNFAALLRYTEFEAAVPLENLKTTFATVAFVSDNFKVRFKRRTPL